jgi:hypothetical protein
MRANGEYAMSFTPKKTATTDKVLKLALAYARKGWRVVPLYADDPVKYAERYDDIDKPLKRPRIKEWQRRGTTDEATIRDWWRRWPDSNVGVVCGPTTGFWVLDVDTGGERTLSSLEKKHSRLPKTREHRSPSGGRHLLFKCDERTALIGNEVKFAPGLDTRAGDNGQVVMPPSVTRVGKYRRSAKFPIAKTPQWLIDEITKAEAAQVNRDSVTEHKPTFVLPAVIPEGERNQTLFQYASQLRRKGGEWDAIVAELRKVNADKKRCPDPLPDKELQTIANHACKYPPGESRSSGDLPECLLDLSPNCGAWLTKDPPPLSYIIRSYLQKGEVAQVAGQAGVSKSTWTIQAAASLAGGVPFFGVENTITRAYRVLYLMLERASDSFQRRWRKGVDHIGNGIEADGVRAKFYKSITANFTAKALAGQSLGLVEWKNNEWIQTPAVDAFIAQIIAAAIEIIFFDPLSRLYNGVEDGAVQAAIIRVFERITQETGCSVVFVHHSGIVQRDGAYTGRGSSQLTDNTSETIAFKEFKGAGRNTLGDYKAALRHGEEDAAIVQVEHVRCSDGPLNSIVQFVRSPETGLLRRITTIDQKEAGDLVKEWITDNPQFHKWAKDRQFTQTELVRSRTVALGAIAEKQTKELVIEAAKVEVLKEAGSRKGYPLYKWKPPSGASVAHHSAPLHHSKMQAEKRAR